MNKSVSMAYAILSILLLLGLSGCSRTLDHITKWKLKGNVEKLVLALEDERPEIRAAAADALGELRAEPAVDPLARLYEDSSETVVISAVKALSAIGNDPAASHLMLALKLEQAQVRELAASGLGSLKVAAAVSELIPLMGDVEDSVACAAAKALGQIGEASASAGLANMLTMPSAELRLACAEALALTGGPDAPRGLVGALADADERVAKAASASLLALKAVSVPAALEGLRSEKAPIRRGVIVILRKLEAIPTKGADYIWYQLARVSTDNKTALDLAAVRKLVRVGEPAIETLLQAVSHKAEEIREHAFVALEYIGERAVEPAIKAAQAASGKAWFELRSRWQGARSWRLDLWGALTALNPAFELDESRLENMKAQGRKAFNAIVATDFKGTREYIPALIELLGDRTVPPPKQPDYDEFGMPVIKKATDRFRGEANQQMARTKLTAAGGQALFPLIAAVSSSNRFVAGHAAEVLGDIGDTRATVPLMDAVKRQLAEGKALSGSQIHKALQKLDDLEAEPVLKLIRPNSDRAIRLFERQYQGVRAISADIRDAGNSPDESVNYRVAYEDGGERGELLISFVKNEQGEWLPTPPLPEQLP